MMIIIIIIPDVDRSYTPRKEGERGLIRGLEVYIHGSEERLIQAARGDKIDGLEAASVLKRSKKEKRLEESSTWSVFEAD